MFHPPHFAGRIIDNPHTVYKMRTNETGAKGLGCGADFSEEFIRVDLRVLMEAFAKRLANGGRFKTGTRAGRHCHAAMWF